MTETFEVSTVPGSTSYSDYPEPPSEADVSFSGSTAHSELSLWTCASSVSQYSQPPEADVSFSKLIESGQMEVLYTALENSQIDESGIEDGLVFSQYSLPKSEADVEPEMLYPQVHIHQLEAPERVECDTPAPPQMYATQS